MQSTQMNDLQTAHDALPDLVIDEGYPLHRQHKSWAGNICPSCGESSAESNKFNVFVGKDNKWRYNCFGCGVYGDTADFLAISRNITLGQALGLLDKGKLEPRLSVVTGSRPKGKPASAASIAAQKAQEEKEQAALQRVIVTLRECALDDGPRVYLKARGLTDRTIDMAVDSGQLRMLPTNPEKARRFLMDKIGKTALVDAGLMKEDKQWPALAFKPLLAIEPGRLGFEARVASFTYEGSKAIRYGSMTWPWFFKHKATLSSLLVCEGFIDALSAWQSVPEVDAAFGIPGVNGWTPRWFGAIKDTYPDALILLGMDEDKPGQQCNAKLVECLSNMDMKHSSLHPPCGNDWNASLMHTLKL